MPHGRTGTHWDLLGLGIELRTTHFDIEAAATRLAPHRRKTDSAQVGGAFAERPASEGLAELGGAGGGRLDDVVLVGRGEQAGRPPAPRGSARTRHPHRPTSLTVPAPALRHHLPAHLNLEEVVRPQPRPRARRQTRPYRAGAETLPGPDLHLRHLRRVRAVGDPPYRRVMLGRTRQARPAPCVLPSDARRHLLRRLLLLGDDRLWGANRRRKGTDTLAALKSIRAARPDGATICVIMDNLGGLQRGPPQAMAYLVGGLRDHRTYTASTEVPTE